MRYVTTTSSVTGESSNLFGGPVKMAAAGKHMKGDVWTTNKFPAEVAGEVDMAGKGVGMVGSEQLALSVRREQILIPDITLQSWIICEVLW